MGTRSITRFKEHDSVIASIYRQFDGYLSGQGKEIKEFLLSREMVNGIPGDKKRHELFNGVGCAAAALIAHLKGSDAGYIYMTHEEDRQEFIYNLSYDGRWLVQVLEWEQEIYNGPLDEMPCED